MNSILISRLLQGLVKSLSSSESYKACVFVAQYYARFILYLTYDMCFEQRIFENILSLVLFNLFATIIYFLG